MRPAHDTGFPLAGWRALQLGGSRCCALTRGKARLPGRERSHPTAHRGARCPDGRCCGQTNRESSCGNSASPPSSAKARPGPRCSGAASQPGCPRSRRGRRYRPDRGRSGSGSLSASRRASARRPSPRWLAARSSGALAGEMPGAAGGPGRARPHSGGRLAAGPAARHPRVSW